MEKLMKKISCLLIVLFLSFIRLAASPPRVTVVIVVDQFAYHYIEKLSPYFKHGFKTFIDNGINFENAYHPHAAPATATGHATIGTGAVAKDHGIVLNGWFDKEGQSVYCVEDSRKAARVFGENGFCSYGISAKNLMVDSLSDQIIFASKKPKLNKVFSISYKNRAAALMAGRKGKAVWYDDDEMMFTSSQAYFNGIPSWVKNFNKKYKIKKLKKTWWPLAKDKDHPVYEKYATKKLNHTRLNLRLAGKNRSLKVETEGKSGKNFNPFFLTPQSNKLLFKLAKQCIESNLSHDVEKFVLWISLSSFDKLGHLYGPESLEMIDTVFHIDKQIKNFINYVHGKIGKGNTLFVLTADHGVAPIPERMKKRGMSLANRVYVKPLIDEMNKLILDKFGIEEFVKSFKTSQFFFNKKALEKVDAEKMLGIRNTLVGFLKRQPGIKSVWSPEQLVAQVFEDWKLEQFAKNQVYPSRSGDLICIPQPYSIMSGQMTGTGHRSPYEYDTHVPLIFYQPEVLKQKKVFSRVWITQLATTLAKLLDVSNPSATQFDPLPAVL
jgi:arylsulfatase A-like enzyme